MTTTERRVRLIGKEYVALFDKEVVFLETNPKSCIRQVNDLVRIDGIYDVKYTLRRVKWDGFGASGELSMKNYGSVWRLWTVAVAEPDEEITSRCQWKTQQNRVRH